MSTKQQTFQFELGTDEKIYSTSFKGIVPPDKIHMMLERIQKHLYCHSAGIISKCLDQCHLEYTDFTFKESALTHNSIMRLADHLLHSSQYGEIHGQTGNADNYYAIMDHQKWISSTHCEGCYLAVKKISPIGNGTFNCKIIGQIFKENNAAADGYFAIRERRGNRLHDIARVTGEPVLPPFGCIDTLGLLLSIDRIKTAAQAERIALL